MNTVRQALCDPLPEVREAAAHTFDNLHLNIGTRALDDILPKLLKQLVSIYLTFYLTLYDVNLSNCKTYVSFLFYLNM